MKVIKHPFSDLEPVTELTSTFTPDKHVKRIAREELSKTLQSNENKINVEFELSPKLLGLKEVIKGKNIGIRDIPSGKRIRPEDI